MKGICTLLVCLVALPLYPIDRKSKWAKTVADSVDCVAVQQIRVSGNQITKEHIILKELSFVVGDTLPVVHLAEAAEEARHNLLNTSLFNFVYVTYRQNPDKTVLFDIKVEERWYLWVFPVVEQSDRNLSSFIGNGNWDMVNYGVYVRRDNFRGRQETLKFRAQVGYINKLNMSYQSADIPGRLAWGFLIDYNIFDHVSVATANDRPVYLKTPGRMLQRSSVNQLYVQYRHSLYNRQQLLLCFRQNSISDTVKTLNAGFLGNNEMSNRYFELAYSLSFDTRDSRIYPLKGSLKSVTFTKYGLGIWGDEPDHANALARLFVYKPLGRKFDWGTEVTGLLGTTSDVPYFNRTGIGYREFIGGYEYYVVDGPSFAMAKNRLLFELVPTKVKNLNFIPLKKFSKIHYAVYMRAFYDGGYVWNKEEAPSNRLANNYLYGYGAGIDFVTFYDKAFSLYYAFNSIGEGGVFFHLNMKF